MTDQPTYAPRPVSDFAVPYSEEAEEAVIGAVLVNPESYLTVASFLKNDDFYLIRHRYIWQALERLSARNEAVDYLTLLQELRDMGWEQEIGGAAYLTRLINSTPSAMHAEFYGHIVERAALRRRLLVTADEIRGLALDEALDIESVIAKAETKLFSVTEQQLKREFVSMHEAVNEYWDRIEQLMQMQAGSLGVPSGFRKLDELLGGFQRSDLLIFAGRPGMGKCVAAGTLIATAQGMMPIECLRPAHVAGIPDDEGGVYYPLKMGVQTPDGLRQTSHFYDSGVRPTIKITTRAGYTLTGTHVHPVLVLSSEGEKCWKPLNELQAGDFVAVQRHAPVWGNETKLPEFIYDCGNKRGTTKFPQLPSELSPDLAYFWGLLIGDGCLTEKNYVKISSADPEIVSVFYHWASITGLHARHNKNYDYHIGSIVMRQWLKHNDIDGYAHEKHVPRPILQASEDCVCAFLQGLFDTDGHAEVQNGYIQYVTISEKLAQQVHLLLLQFGIVSKLTFKINAYKGSWQIRITGDAARRFYQKIGFRLSRKQQRHELLPAVTNSNLDVVPYLPNRTSKIPDKLPFHKYFNRYRSPSYPMLARIAEYAPEVQHLLEPQYYWDAITHVEDGGMQHCYDLVVPDGHAFVANGIVNHNTSFLLSAAVNAARLGARVAIFTMEMGADQLVQRIFAMETGINTQKLRLGQLNQAEAARFAEAAGRIARFPIFIDDTPALNPIQMRTKCRRLQHEHGIDMVIVDYMQLMNAGGTYQNNRVQEISYISRSLKELARELNVPIFSAAQLSRAVEQRQDKRPVLSDLRESGCLTGESRVWLHDEARYVPIRDLMGREGVRVLSLNPTTYTLEPGEVTNAFCTGIRPVYKLTTQLGRTIRATGNHKFLTIEGWQRLDTLACGTRIALPRTMLSTATNQTMTDAELGLLGHLIGDGCNLPTHAVQYTTRETDLAEIVLKLAQAVFGDAVRPRIYREPGKNWYQVFIPPTRHLTHGVYNPVRSWLTELDVWGLRSHEKFIPEKVFQQPNEAIALFLRHLWATDGCISVRKTTRGTVYPHIYYATSSKQLATDVQSLLMRLNITARIKTVPQPGKGRDQYHIILGGGTDLAIFVEHVRAVGEYKSNQLCAVADYIANHVTNTNRDVIPHNIWRMYAVPEMRKKGISTRKFHKELGMAYAGTVIFKQNVSRERAARIARVIGSQEIAALAQSDVYWDQIASIEPDGEEAVYDLTIAGHHNFLANDVIVHNSIEQDSDIVIFLYRDVVYNEATEFPNQADLIVAKHRNGPTGTVSLYFDNTLTKFMDGAVRSVNLGEY